MKYTFILLSILSCGPTVNRWAPLILRPNTTSLEWVMTDSTVMNLIMKVLQKSLPNEQAFCLIGHVEINQADSSRGIKLTGSYPAQEVAAYPDSINFATYDAGCNTHDGQTIGFLHDHPNGRFVCTHSDADAGLLFGAPSFAFAMVICPDGSGEVLWQDGRRDEFIWASRSP